MNIGIQVGIQGMGLFTPAGIGEAGAGPGQPGRVPGFRARNHIRNRKSLKLMTRAVKLGMSAVNEALAEASDLAGVPLDGIPPVRRAMFVGANPGVDTGADLMPAMDVAVDEAGRLDLERFGREGLPRIHPLWLVKGLSNNVLGLASAVHDFQGPNANYCQDDAGGAVALREAVATLAEHRADVAVAGAADSLVGAERFLPGRALGEASVFLVLVRGEAGCRFRIRSGSGAAPPPVEDRFGYLGVAGELSALCVSLLSGGGPVALPGTGAALVAESREPTD